MIEPIHITRGAVRIGDHSAVVAVDGTDVRLALAAPGGEMTMPTYVARAHAENVLAACKAADMAAAASPVDPLVPRRPPAA